MEPFIDVIGVGADGALRPELRDLVCSADFLAGGERHLRYFPEARGERFVIRDNVGQLMQQLAIRCASQHCVVLASGDPLFYGVGVQVVAAGFKNIRLHPSISSMQLAFARAGLPWDRAVLASIHGRDLRTTLLPMLGRPLIGLLTQDGDSPASVARFFIRHDLAGYEAFVGEDLGAADERVTRYSGLPELAQQHFAPLNYLILRRTDYPGDRPEMEKRRACVPGIPDSAFARPDKVKEVMTRQEVRSVIVGKMCKPVTVGAIVWDIGAGLGTVSVELAVLRPYLEVLAIERVRERAALLRENRRRFDAYNIRVLEGGAPEILDGEPLDPALVFVGGSGGCLASILDLVAKRLLAGGRLVASFVTLENLSLTLERLRSWSWPCDVTEIHVAHSDDLAGLTGLKPQRGVFVVSADKPGGGA